MLGFSFPYNEDFQICTKNGYNFILHTTPILNDCQYHAILVSSQNDFKANYIHQYFMKL